MASTLKVGDKVRFNSKVEGAWWFKSGQSGIISAIHDLRYLPIDVRVDGDDEDECLAHVEHYMLDLVRASPSVVCDLRLKPQSKTILRHLKTHGHISPAKAQVVYGITRLAACIFDIRKVGYEITTTIRCDDQGHRYSYYEMAKAN
jgi:Helix-turn-helix domain